jgi:ABC-type branched-subunit amino acid transport system substrate-binding protein
MPMPRAARLFGGLIAAVAVLGMALSAHAQEKKIKIGVVFDLTGPLAGGGSELEYLGAKIMLDHYAKTGVEGYKVEAVYADARSSRKRSTCCSDFSHRRSACRWPPVSSS